MSCSPWIGKGTGAGWSRRLIGIVVSIINIAEMVVSQSGESTDLPIYEAFREAIATNCNARRIIRLRLYI